MKIPSSSSIFLATLAISSSSSSLAAPAGDAPQSEGGMTSSSSNHHMASGRDSMAQGIHAEARADGSAEDPMANDLDTRALLSCDIPDIPVVGDILNPVFHLLCSGNAANAASIESSATTDEEDALAQLQSAVSVAIGTVSAESSKAIQTVLPTVGTPQNPLAARDVDSGTDVSPSTAQASSTVSTSSLSATSTMAVAVEAADPAIPTPASSPAIPSMPPNTPITSAA